MNKFANSGKGLLSATAVTHHEGSRQMYLFDVRGII